MRKAISMLGLVVAMAGLSAGVASAGGTGSNAVGGDGKHPQFNDPTDIDNRYLPLSKFDRCLLKGEEDGAKIKVVRTLLDRTEPFRVDGETVRVAIIKDKAWEDGELVERTLDYFGQATNGAVYYFGEDVDDIEDGEVVGHDGQWRYGRDTNVLGVAMPRNPQIGETWYFEFVPGITIERDKMIERIDEKTIRGNTYEDVIRIREFQDPGNEVEDKLYARGVGNIRELPPDGRVDLVECDD
jgi:hypothetical protein